jgi:hypothetical protein
MMMMKSGIFFLFGLTAVCFAQPREEIRRIELRDPVSVSPDPLVYEISRTFDENGFPSGYHMKLITDVCEDTVCKILNVTLYWDEMGRYVRLETPPGAPLTKQDHVEFSADDNRQLNEILRNRNSVMARYSFTEVSGGKDHEPDAVSGATPPEVQTGVVKGAAYTTWVLWQWANGEITDRMVQMTKENSSADFIHHCLQSADQDRIEYALEYIGNDPQFWRSVSRALDQMDYGNLGFAVQYLGQTDEIRLAESVGQVPQRVSEQIVKHFSKQPEPLSPDVLSVLVSRLPQMSYYELYTSLDLFDDNGLSSEKIRQNLSVLTNSPNPFIARKAKEYFQTNGL